MDLSLSTIVGLEWFALAFLASSTYWREGGFRLFLAVALFCILAGSASLSDSRPVFFQGLIDPGSWATRLWTPPMESWLRRLAEPSLIALLFVLIGLNTSMYFSLSIAALLSCWAIEGIALAASAPASVGLLHAVLVQLFFISAIAALAGYSSASPNRRFIRAAVLYPIFFAGAAAIAFAYRNTPPVLTAVHYYSWFPENWKAGFSGEHQTPPVLPALGKYNSDGTTFEQHLKWFEQAGIDVVVFDWWPRNRDVRQRVDTKIAALRGRKERFAILYETLAIKETRDGAPATEGPNDVFVTAARASQLARDWTRIAANYMREENYLRVNGKPVLFVYASRQLAGDVHAAIDAARKAVRKETGFDLYIVGDEIYFNVLDYAEDRGIFLRSKLSPNWNRIASFDAITCYNPYDSSRREHGGEAGAAQFFTDVEALYRRYRGVAAVLGIEFIPGVLPGYDDKVLRPKLDHFVLPRSYQDQDFFQTGLERLVRPFLGGASLRMFVVTSWNEWNEGTQIEPSAEGYGERYLNELRAFAERL